LEFTVIAHGTTLNEGIQASLMRPNITVKPGQRKRARAERARQ